MTKKQSANQNRHNFLLTFFKQVGDFHEEKEVNGFWLVKQYNRNSDSWQVAIFTKQAHDKMRSAQELFKSIPTE